MQSLLLIIQLWSTLNHFDIFQSLQSDISKALSIHALKEALRTLVLIKDSRKESGGLTLYMSKDPFLLAD
jgi:hypothetical protein